MKEGVIDIKYAYATVITNDYYIDGVLAINARLKHLNSKYPFLVLITNNVNTQRLQGLNLVIIPELTLIENQHRFKYTINKFQVLLLTEYDKVLFLDADLFPIENMDKIFDDNDYLNSYILCSPRSNIDSHVHGGLFLAFPNKNEFNKILQVTLKTHFKDDEEILEYFYGSIKDFYFKNSEYIHYGGTPKYWEGKNYNFDILTKGTSTNCLSFFENFYKERDHVL